MGDYMITHKQRLLGQEVRNVFYYETTAGEPDDGEWQDICDEIRADYIAELQNGHVDDWSFYAMDFRRVDTPGLPTFEKTPTAGTVVGSAAIDPLPTQIALLVSLKGAFTKPNKARSYTAGWGENQVTDGLFVQSALDEAETFIDLQSDLNSIGTNPLQRISAQWNSGHTAVVATNNISGTPAVGNPIPEIGRAHV